jgi:hypothetical protein
VKHLTPQVVEPIGGQELRQGDRVFVGLLAGLFLADALASFLFLLCDLVVLLLLL